MKKYIYVLLSLLSACVSPGELSPGLQVLAKDCWIIREQAQCAGKRCLVPVACYVEVELIETAQ